MTKLVMRSMTAQDIESLHAAFAMQEWERDKSLFERYYREQQEGSRHVVIAECNQQLAGYATIMKEPENGPFRGSGYPEIADFNVFINYQRKGIGNQIMEQCEEIVSRFSDVVTLGVGMHPGYGPAQRLYVKRGYIPDGSGLWYKEKLLPVNAPCINDDSLVLYLSKQLLLE